MTKLPNGYQEVEYIESTGTQWIDTGLICKSGYKIDFKYYTVSSSNVDQSIIGVDDVDYDNPLYRGINYTSGFESVYFNYNYDRHDITSSQAVGNTYEGSVTLRNGNQTIIINGSTVYSDTDTLNVTGNSNLLLFTSRGTNYALIKLYEMKIYDENDILIRNFVPCYRKSDSVIGLYDVVNNVFYTNSGTGTFTKGADVIKKKYIDRYYLNGELYGIKFAGGVDWQGDMSNRALAQTASLGSGFYTGVYAKQDGTKIFFSCGATQRIYECTLGTPFDISSLSLSKYISSTYPEDLTFSPDGTKMFVLRSGVSPYQVIRYTLSTAWDISTATQDQTITAGTENGDRGIYIAPDGKAIYRSMAGQDTLHKATMTTAWDLTTASAWDSINNYGGVAIWFGNGGKFFARKPDNSSSLYWYELSTPYDLSTITNSGIKSLGGNDYGLGLWYNDTGTIAFLANGDLKTITKYTL